MKIAVIAQDLQLLKDIQKFLSEADNPYPLSTTIGGVQEIVAAVEQEQPDLLLLEGYNYSPMELQTLNDITSRFPGLGVVWLDSDQTPERLIEIMRAGVREVLPTPLTRNVLIEVVERFQQRIILARTPVNQCKVLAFVSCKGGSGATFLATNIAYTLATLENKRVALFDFNLQFGNASLFLHDALPTSSIADVANQIQRLDGSFLASSMIEIVPNLAILPAPEEPEKAMIIKPEHVKRLFQVAMQYYDFVIVDIGRELNSVSVSVLDQADLIFPVLQQSLPSIRNAKRMLNSFHALNYPDDKLRLVVNRYEKKADITLDDIKKTVQLEIFKAVPNNYSVVNDSVNQGIPAIKLARRSPVAKSLQEIAYELTHDTASKESPLKKLFSFKKNYEPKQTIRE